MKTLPTWLWDTLENRLHPGWRLSIQVSINTLLILGITKLISATLPNGFRGVFFPLPYIIALAITSLSIILTARFIDKRDFRDYGIHLRSRFWWLDFLAGGVIGCIFPILMLFLAAHLGWIKIIPLFKTDEPHLSFPLAVFLSIILYLCVSLFEESARAYQIRNLFEAFPQHNGVEWQQCSFLPG